MRWLAAALAAAAACHEPRPTAPQPPAPSDAGAVPDRRDVPANGDHELVRQGGCLSKDRIPLVVAGVEDDDADALGECGHRRGESSCRQVARTHLLGALRITRTHHPHTGLWVPGEKAGHVAPLGSLFGGLY